MRVFTVSLLNRDRQKVCGDIKLLARNIKHAVRKAAQMQGYKLSNRWDALTRLDNGLYMFVNRAEFTRDVHRVRFVCTGF